MFTMLHLHGSRSGIQSVAEDGLNKNCGFPDEGVFT